LVNAVARPRVGLLTLMFEIYDAFEYLEPDMLDFCGELESAIGEFCEVSWPGICKTSSQVESALGGFESGGVDIVIVVLLTYTPSHVAARALVDTRLPILLFNTQRLIQVMADTDPRDMIRNHGVHGVQDLANVLVRADRSFGIVTGHYQDRKALDSLSEWCMAASTASLLRSTRVGAIGHFLSGMGDFALDETRLLADIGVEVHRLSQGEVAEMARNAPGDLIAAQMEEDRRRYEVSGDVAMEEHEESSRLEWAMRKILSDRELNSFTVNFMSVEEEGSLVTLPFLATSKLLSEGYGYAAEGDLLTSAMVAAMQGLAGSANFTEMFTMDPVGGSVLMSHMGESNPSMARDDGPIELVPSDFQLADLERRPLLLRFSLAPGEVTLVNLTTGADGGFKITATEGRVLDFKPIPGINTPHFKFQPDGPLEEFLTELCREGTSHHFALAYGRWSGVLSKVAHVLGLDFSRV